jgi:hypothetical protein
VAEDRLYEERIKGEIGRTFPPRTKPTGERMVKPDPAHPFAGVEFRVFKGKGLKRKETKRGKL